MGANNKIYRYKITLKITSIYLIFFITIIFFAAGDEHKEMTFTSYLPVFLLQLTGFVLLSYLVAKFAVPPIGNAIKSKKEKTEMFLKSLDEQMLYYTNKLAQLNEQFNNIKQIIEERKKEREKEIIKIANAVEKELDEIKETISSRIKLEEDLETLKLKIFLSNFVKNVIHNFIYTNLTGKDLQNIQLKYEQEFIEKFLELKKNNDFINKLKSL